MAGMSLEEALHLLSQPMLTPEDQAVYLIDGQYDVWVWMPFDDKWRAACEWWDLDNQGYAHSLVQGRIDGESGQGLVRTGFDAGAAEIIAQWGVKEHFIPTERETHHV